MKEENNYFALKVTQRDIYLEFKGTYDEFKKLVNLYLRGSFEYIHTYKLKGFKEPVQWLCSYMWIGKELYKSSNKNKEGQYIWIKTGITYPKLTY